MNTVVDEFPFCTSSIGHSESSYSSLESPYPSSSPYDPNSIFPLESLNPIHKNDIFSQSLSNEKQRFKTSGISGYEKDKKVDDSIIYLSSSHQESYMSKISTREKHTLIDDKYTPIDFNSKLSNYETKGNYESQEGPYNISNEYTNKDPSSSNILFENPPQKIDLVNTKSILFLCDLCKGSFDSKSKLQRHTKDVHEGNEVVCEFCGRAFKCKKDLKDHSRFVHHGIRDYECNSCERVFEKRSYLISHVRVVHQKIRNYICSHCGKSFGNSGNLAQHVKVIHEGKKDWICELCHKSFGEKSNLKKHTKTVHERRRDHECAICGKAFGDRGDFQKHVRVIHQGIKDHVCEFCSKEFIRRIHLQSHLTERHPSLVLAQFSSISLYMEAHGERIKNKKMLERKRDKEALEASRGPYIPKETIVSRCEEELRVKPPPPLSAPEKEEEKEKTIIFSSTHVSRQSSKDQNTSRSMVEKSKGGEPRSQTQNSILRQENIEGSTVSENIEGSTVSENIEGSYKCLMCFKTFSKHEYCKSHIRYTHKNLKEYTCEHCSKDFKWKVAYKRHLKGVHGEHGALERVFDSVKTLSRREGDAIQNHFDFVDSSLQKQGNDVIKDQENRNDDDDDDKEEREKVKTREEKGQECTNNKGKEIRSYTQESFSPISSKDFSKSSESSNFQKHSHSQFLHIYNSSESTFHCTSSFSHERIPPLHESQIHENNDDDDENDDKKKQYMTKSDESGEKKKTWRKKTFETQRLSKGCKGYVCENCGKTFGGLRGLRAHKETNHEGKKFSCHICQKTYGGSGGLRQHMKGTHENSGLTCSSCEKVYMSSRALRIHFERLHLGIVRHSCTHCGNTFNSSSNLRSHIKIVHEGIKDFPCLFCGKEYGDMSNIKRHIRTVHEGRKDFMCETCGKYFGEKGDLKKHIKSIHLGLRDFKCNFCSQEFIRRSHLNNHLSISHGVVVEKNEHTFSIIS